MFSTILLFQVALIVGDSHAQGFPGEVLAKHLNNKDYEVARATRIGLTVFQATKHSFDIPKAKPKFIFLGSNDAGNLQQITKQYLRLKKLYPTAYLIGPPFFKNPVLDKRSYEVSKIQKKIFKEKYLDSRSCTFNNTERYPDAVHFNYFGASDWINCILKSVKLTNY